MVVVPPGDVAAWRDTLAAVGAEVARKESCPAGAATQSAALADQLCAARSWRFCRDQVMAAYPVSKSQRRERFAAVMAGMRDYSSDELDGELLDLYATYQELGGSGRHGAEGFLAQLRSRAKQLEPESQAAVSKD